MGGVLIFHAAANFSHTPRGTNMNKIALLLLAICAGCGGGGGGASSSMPPPSGVPSGSGLTGASNSPTPSPTATPFAPGSLRYWIIQGPAAQAMASDPVAVKYFANPTHAMVLPVAQAAPSSWKVVPMQTFTSFATFASTVLAGDINPSTKTLIYDNENWAFTPPNEQSDPAGYTNQFATLAHQHGWTVIASHSGAGSPEGVSVAAGMCRYADSLSIQSQGSEANLAQFTKVVGLTAAACRAANPAVKVIAGISTGPSGQIVTAAQIAAAIVGVRNVVDGYWLNIPQQSQYCAQCTAFNPALASQALALLPSPAP